MQKLMISLALGIALTLGLVVFLFVSRPENQAAASHDEHDEQTESPALATAMMQLQYFQRKFGHALAQRNQPLSSFYLHELEETMEDIADHIPSYEGYPVGPLTKSMGIPALESLEAVFEDASRVDWAQGDARYDNLIKSCNDCHVATEHGFIKVLAAPSGEPFDQDFSP